MLAHSKSNRIRDTWDTWVVTHAKITPEHVKTIHAKARITPGFITVKGKARVQVVQQI